jgi:streptogramin lyase
MTSAQLRRSLCCVFALTALAGIASASAQARPVARSAALVGPAAAQTATMNEYKLQAGSQPYFSIAGDPKSGDVFFGGLVSPGVDAVGRITPAGSVTWYPTGFGSGAFPGDGMAMHDGDAWFGVTNTAWIGYLHFNPDGSTSTGHLFVKSGVGSLWTPDPVSGPIYFTDSNNLGRLDFSGDPTNPTITECSLLGEFGATGNLTGDPATDELYFTDGRGMIGKASGAFGNGSCAGVSTVSTPTPNAAPGGITLGGDGRLWFTEYHNGAVGAVSTSLTGIVEYPAGGTPTDIAAGPDGNVYATDQQVSRVLQVRPDGSISSSFFTVSGNADPTVITRGPDGALWFPEIQAKAIGRLVVTTPSKTTIASGHDPATYGQKGSIVATVKSVPPGTVPTGDVQFDVNGSPFETATLDASGKARLHLADLEVGSYTITAEYLGDTTFEPSTSKALQQAVDPSGTSVDLKSALNPAPHGSTGAITATVKAVPPGGGTPTGTITFKIDGVPQAPVALADGRAMLKLKTLTVGSHQIVAVYSGSIDFNSSTSPAFTQVIT